ncbi:MAG: hypothetical protein ACYSSM_07495 [Planctomycetota bacterium]|jgi:hypothetical protein
MKTKTKKKITITLNEQDAYVLQNILYSFDWSAAGDHYFAALHEDLESLTGRGPLTYPWIEKEALLKTLSELLK